MSRSTRRGALAAGLAGGAALLAGCGSDDSGSSAGATSTNDDSAHADAAVVNDVLKLEQQAVALYTGALRRLAGPAKELGRTLVAAEQEHVDQLSSAVGKLGGVARRPKGAYDLPQLTGQAEALRAFDRMEARLIAAYLDALPKITDPDVRTTMAQILAAEAEHAAVLDGRLGREQAPDALVRGSAKP